MSLAIDNLERLICHKIKKWNETKVNLPIIVVLLLSETVFISFKSATVGDLVKKKKKEKKKRKNYIYIYIYNIKKLFGLMRQGFIQMMSPTNVYSGIHKESCPLKNWPPVHRKPPHTLRYTDESTLLVSHF